MLLLDIELKADKIPYIPKINTPPITNYQDLWSSNWITYEIFPDFIYYALALLYLLHFIIVGEI